MRAFFLYTQIWFLKAQTRIYNALRPYLKRIGVAACLVNAVYWGYQGYLWIKFAPQENNWFFIFLQHQNSAKAIFFGFFMGITILWLCFSLYLIIFFTLGCVQKMSSQKIPQLEEKSLLLKQQALITAEQQYLNQKLNQLAAEPIFTSSKAITHTVHKI